MNYNYYAKTDYYEYLASGVQAWELLIPISSNLKKNDTVTVIELNNAGDETGLASVGTVQFISSEGILTVSGYQSFFYINQITNITMYKLFRATITQSGTSIPTATILENTTGLVPVFSRDDIGFYGIDNLGITNANKVVILFATTNDDSEQQLAVPLQNGHEVSIETLLSGADTDNVMTAAGIDIKIYP